MEGSPMEYDFSKELDVAGQKYKVALEARIDSGVPPPNAPATIMKKGHDLTLRDTWAYRNSIDVRVTPTEAEIGVFDPKIAEYVYFNEHGTKTIPPRPVFGPVADGPGEQFLDELEEAIADKMIDEFER
jgi:hypothetical protein